MDHSSRLTFGALLASMCLAASAGYAQPSPPSGWGGSAGSWTYRAANASEWLNGTVRTNAALSVGGRTVTIPAAIRVAANAGTFASRWMFANPFLLTAAGAAWLASQYISWDGSRWVYSDPSSSSVVYPQSTGYQQVFNGKTYYTAMTYWRARLDYSDSQSSNSNYVITSVVENSGGWSVYYTFQVSTGATFNSSDWTNVVQSSSCPAGWYVTDQGCVQQNPAQPQQVPQTEDEFVTRVAPQIQPEDIPEWLPYTVPLPVDNPVINPSADPQPQSRPLRIPLGEPQPVPNTDPQQYRQPVIRVSPAPSPSSPWQLDLTPEDVVSTSPVGIREPSADPLPEGSTSAPTETDDFCAKNPDVLACQKEIKLGELQPVPLVNEDRELEIDAETGQTAACPAPVSLSVGGRVVDISYDMVCEFADLVRPLFIGFAWLSAALTFMGVSRRS